MITCKKKTYKVYIFIHIHQEHTNEYSCLYLKSQNILSSYLYVVQGVILGYGLIIVNP